MWVPTYAVGMSNYRRVWVPGGTYLFTANLLERRRCPLVDHIDLLRCIPRDQGGATFPSAGHRAAGHRDVA